MMNHSSPTERTRFTPYLFCAVSYSLSVPLSSIRPYLQLDFFHRIVFLVILLVNNVNMFNISSDAPIYLISLFLFIQFSFEVSISYFSGLIAETVFSMPDCDQLSSKPFVKRIQHLFPGTTLRRRFRMKQHKSATHARKPHALPDQKLDYTLALLHVTS